MNNNYSVSESDIVTALRLAGEPLESSLLQDERRLKNLLWQMGLDSNHHFVERKCEHRNMSGVVVTCIRYEGAERTDESWMKSGYATAENSKFADMDRELAKFRTSSTSSEYHLNR